MGHLESLTFFKDVLQVGHTLDMCSRDSFIMASNGIDLAVEVFKHMRILQKKPTIDLCQR